MKKTFDTTSLVNELRGQSVFFPTKEDATKLDASTPTPPVESQPQQTTKRNLSNKQESLQASYHASTLAPEELIEETRKILKLLGREVIYVRSTQEEKDQIGDIVYTLRRQGIKTSDNEICRIAINVVLAEYKTNGEQSVLAKVLKALHT